MTPKSTQARRSVLPPRSYKELKQRDWIRLTAKVNLKYHPIFRGEGPVLTALKVEPGQKPQEDVVTFS